MKEKGKHTTGGADLDVEGSDAELLAAGSDVLGSQHSGVGGGLVTVGLDLHTTSNTGDGFTAAVEIVSFLVYLAYPWGTPPSIDPRYQKIWAAKLSWELYWVNVRKIGNVNEGVVERGEDTGNTENELAYMHLLDQTVTDEIER